MKAKSQLIFWIIVVAMLVVLFSASLGGVLLSLFFVTFLFPVIFGTSLFFNHFLVPRYLLTGKKLTFSLYFFYMLVISIYLELLVMVLAFVILADYQIEHLGKIAGDIYLLTIILYLVVFVNGFIEILIGFKNRESQLSEIEKKREVERQGFILIKTNRKNVRVALDKISYMESLGDYVKIHMSEETVITKEKISVLLNKLPETFLRVHRSFVISSPKVSSFGKEQITIEDKTIPIGRKFKKEVLDYLEVSVTVDKTIRH